MTKSPPPRATAAGEQLIATTVDAGAAPLISRPAGDSAASSAKAGGVEDSVQNPVGATELSRGRFRVVRFVGRGGLGVVNMARDEKLKRDVALKGIRPDHRGNAAVRARFLKEAVDVLEKNKLHDHWMMAYTKNLLGSSLAEQGDFGEAEQLLVTSYEKLKTAQGVSPQQRRDSCERVARLYEAWSKPEKAAAWRQRNKPSNDPNPTDAKND